jgi:hypothetical protein
VVLEVSRGMVKKRHICIGCEGEKKKERKKVECANMYMNARLGNHSHISFLFLEILAYSLATICNGPIKIFEQVLVLQ